MRARATSRPSSSANRRNARSLSSGTSRGCSNLLADRPILFGALGFAAGRPPCFRSTITANFQVRLKRERRATFCAKNREDHNMSTRVSVAYYGRVSDLKQSDTSIKD